MNRPNKVQMNTPPKDLRVIPSESSRIGQSLRFVLFQYLPIVGHYYYRINFQIRIFSLTTTVRCWELFQARQGARGECGNIYLAILKQSSAPHPALLHSLLESCCTKVISLSLDIIKLSTWPHKLSIKSYCLLLLYSRIVNLSNSDHQQPAGLSPLSL